MTYIRKTKDVFTIQGFYEMGWEDVYNCDTFKEAKEAIKSHRENELGVSFKIVKKRERINKDEN